MRPICSNFKILPGFIVMNGITKYFYITLTCSMNCATFLVLSIRNDLASGAKPIFSLQIWDFQCISGFSSGDLVFLGLTAYIGELKYNMIKIYF